MADSVEGDVSEGPEHLITTYITKENDGSDRFGFDFAGEAVFAADIALLYDMRCRLLAVQDSDKTPVLQVPMSRVSRQVVLDALNHYWDHLAKEQRASVLASQSKPQVTEEGHTLEQRLAYLVQVVYNIHDYVKRRSEGVDTQWGVADTKWLYEFTELVVKTDAYAHIRTENREKFPLGPDHYVLTNLTEVARMIRQSFIVARLKNAVATNSLGTIVTVGDVVALFNQLEKLAQDALNSVTVD